MERYQRRTMQAAHLKPPAPWPMFAWFVVLAATIIASLLPESHSSVGRVPPIVTNLAHIPSFAVLTLLTAVVVARWVKVSGWILGGVVLAVVTFGAAIELIQPVVGRTANLSDVAFNLVGAGVASGVYYLWFRRGVK